MRHSKIHILAALVLSGGLTALSPVSTAAQRGRVEAPKSDTVGTVDLTAFLKCREENQYIVDDMRPHLLAALKVVEESEGKSDAQLAKLKPDMVGRGRAGVEHLARAGMKLKFLDDPAGDDALKRSAELRDPVLKACREIALANADKINRSFPALRKRAEGLHKSVRREIDDLSKAGKWIEAEKVLTDAYDDLWVDAAFILDGGQSVQVFNAFLDPERVVMEKLPERSAKATEGKAADAKTAYAEAVGALQKALDDAAAQVGSTGSTTATGDALAGPEAFGKLVEKWSEVQGLADRARGYASIAATHGSQQRQALTELESTHAANSTKIVAGFAKLITSDAGRVSAGDAPALYAGYVRAAAPLVARASDPSYQTTIGAALDAVAAKDAAFAKTAGGYNLVTGDLVRWRRRAAESEAAALRKDFPALPTKYVEVVKAAWPQNGFFRTLAKDSSEATLVGSLPSAIKACWSGHLEGLKVSARNPQAGASAKTAWDGVDARTEVQAATFAGDAEKPKKALKSLLLLDGDAAPLGVDAAVAAWRADNGVWVEVGGTLTAFKLYGYATSWCDAPTATTRRLSLGAFPAEKPDGNMQLDLLSAFETAPSWIMGDGYLVRATAP